MSYGCRTLRFHRRGLLLLFIIILGLGWLDSKAFGYAFETSHGVLVRELWCIHSLTSAIYHYLGLVRLGLGCGGLSLVGGVLSVDERRRHRNLLRDTLCRGQAVLHAVVHRSGARARCHEGRRQLSCLRRPRYRIPSHVRFDLG